jgi:hypothetical protein
MGELSGVSQPVTPNLGVNAVNRRGRMGNMLRFLRFILDAWRMVETPALRAGRKRFSSTFVELPEVIRR